MHVCYNVIEGSDIAWLLLLCPTSVLYIYTKKRIAVEFECGFCYDRTNLSFKSSVTEENLIKPSQFISFQHLRKLFVGHSYSSTGEYIFVCIKCSLFKWKH